EVVDNASNRSGSFGSANLCRKPDAAAAIDQADIAPDLSRMGIRGVRAAPLIGTTVVGHGVNHVARKPTRAHVYYRRTRTVNGGIHVTGNQTGRVGCDIRIRNEAILIIKSRRNTESSCGRRWATMYVIRIACVAG